MPLVQHASIALSVKRCEYALALFNVEKTPLITYFTICIFWLLLLRVFIFRFFEISISFSIFTLLFYLLHKTRNMNHRSSSLDSDSEESPCLTTMDDNNTLTPVVLWNYVRRLFPLSPFRNGVAGIHPGLINFKEIKTPVLKLFLACIERDSLC